MIRDPLSKLVSWNALPALVEAWRTSGQKFVTTNGCFDLLHWGHIQYLCAARRLGDRLLCAINSDDSVKRLKGPSRPLVDARTRALQLAGLECVDAVVVFEEDTPERFLQIARPLVHAKGADYAGKEIPEVKLLQSWGGRVEYLPFEDGFSTTKLIERIKNASR